MSAAAEPRWVQRRLDACYPGRKSSPTSTLWVFERSPIIFAPAWATSAPASGWPGFGRRAPAGVLQQVDDLDAVWPARWSSQIFFRLAKAATDLGVCPATYSRSSHICAVGLGLLVHDLQQCGPGCRSASIGCIGLAAVGHHSPANLILPLIRLCRLVDTASSAVVRHQTPGASPPPALPPPGGSRIQFRSPLLDLLPPVRCVLLVAGLLGQAGGAGQHRSGPT